VLGQTKDIHDLYQNLLRYHNETNVQPDGPYDVTTDAYKQIYNQYGNIFTNYIKETGYYDIFLICSAHGHVMFTQAKESDLGTNLRFGPLKNSPLAKLWSKVVKNKSIQMQDFEAYAPSGGVPASFIGMPIRNDQGEMYGVLALQLSLKKINGVMQERAGMGESGETYLVGQDKLMRSDSYLDPENFSVKASFANPDKGSVDTEAVRRAFNGKTGHDVIIDYNGNPVLSSYDMLNLPSGIKWAVLAEINEAEIREPIDALIYSILIGSVIIVALIVIIAVYIASQIATPLQRAAASLNQLSNGDLTLKVESHGKDEVGQMLEALQHMVERLSGIVGDVQGNAETLSTAANNVSSTAQSLSQGANEQASNIEETSASLEEMTSTIKQNADNAKVTNDISSQGSDKAEKGGQAMEKTNEAMKQISDKISIIEEIAYQTNILALNAAIEAARAGDHGKGFAVVADEVRKLAQRSQTAAQEISNVSSESVQVAEEASKMIADLVPDIKKTADLVQEIAAASNEQSSGISQINNAVAQLDQVTQQNASSSEELAATSEEMSGQASQLQESISFFKIDQSKVVKREMRNQVSQGGGEVQERNQGRTGQNQGHDSGAKKGEQKSATEKGDSSQSQDSEGKVYSLQPKRQQERKDDGSDDDFETF
jgi:methyl-accepting chemotaxis protein